MFTKVFVTPGPEGKIALTRFHIEMRASEGWCVVAYFPTRERAERRLEMLKAGRPQREFRMYKELRV
jgi:hypothetical protein